MKAVLISIKPKWCELIASGKKTLEIRKTRPKLSTPFRCYIYRTKSQGKFNTDNSLNGKIIGEFICNRIENFATDCRANTEQIERISDLACIEMSELIEYGRNSDFLSAWDISDLKIYDKPKALNDFLKPRENFGAQLENIKRAPQSWCYVESLREEVKSD